MNSLRAGMTVAAIGLGTMTAWAAEETAGNPGSAARGTNGYAVTVPTGDRWQLKSSTDGMIYENPIGDPVTYKEGHLGYAKFYRAGFSAAPVPAFSSRKDFLAYVKRAIAVSSETSTYGAVQDDFTETETDGLWLVNCSLNRDDWRGLGMDNHDETVRRIRMRYTLDPREPDRVIIVWYAWYGVTYDEKRFESEAAAFLNSLRKTSQ